MKDRRSRASRAFRTTIPTLLVCSAILLAVTAALFVDRLPQERATLWGEFLLISVALAALAVAIRTIMRSRRGKGRHLAAADRPAATEAPARQPGR